MTAWCDLRMYAVDLESTGVDPDQARIVTAAVAVVGGGLETETLTLLADPGIPIPAEAAAIHGISTEHAQAHGRPAHDVLFVVLNALAARMPGSAIVCHNARYDLTLLDREARRHGLTPLIDREPALHVVDTRVIDLHLDRYRRGPRKLTDLCRHYGAQMDQAHDAAFDAIAAARVAWVIGKLADVVRRVRDHDEAVELTRLRREWDEVRHNLPALHEAQVRWAAEQAAGLENHFERAGRPEHVDRAWPIGEAA